MRYIRRSSFTRFLVVPLMIVTLLSGCYWAVPNEAPATFVAYERPSKVRLTLTGGRKPIVLNPTLEKRAIADLVEDSLMSFPLEEIVQLEQRRFSVLPVLLVAVLAAAVGGFLFLANLSEDDFL